MEHIYSMNSAGNELGISAETGHGTCPQIWYVLLDIYYLYGDLFAKEIGWCSAVDSCCLINFSLFSLLLLQ